MAVAAFAGGAIAASDTWTASGAVVARLGGGAAMVVQAYALCTAPAG